MSPSAMRRDRLRLADGFERYVERYGSGSEVVIALHGGPGADCRTLAPLGSLADDLIQVVLYDQLGGGQSQRPDEDLWTVEFFVGEFRELVLSLGVGPVHLLGQSWGGMLALECALAHPDLIKSLVLCDTFASTRAAVAGFDEILSALPVGLRQAVMAGVADIADPNDPGAVALLDLYARHVRRSFPYEPVSSRESFVRDILPLLDLGPAYQTMWGSNEFAPSGRLRGWDVSARLGEIRQDRKSVV